MTASMTGMRVSNELARWHLCVPTCKSLYSVYNYLVTFITSNGKIQLKTYRSHGELHVNRGDHKIYLSSKTPDDFWRWFYYLRGQPLLIEDSLQSPSKAAMHGVRI